MVAPFVTVMGAVPATMVTDPTGHELMQLAPLMQIVPATSSFPIGAVVPMPTLPVLLMSRREPPPVLS